MPRITTAVISKYQRSRIHQSDFVRGEVTTFGANFTGALEDGDSLVSVTWYTPTPWLLILSNAQIEAGNANVYVDVTIGWGGQQGTIKCVVETDFGKTYNQLYRVNVTDTPFVTGEPQPSQGPSSVTASV